MGSGGFAAAAAKLIGGGVLARRGGGLTASNLAVVLAVVVVASSCGCVCRGQRCHDEERAALLELKESMSTNDLAVDVQEVDCCRWIGVVCSNHTGRVVGIDLYLRNNVTADDTIWYPNFSSLVRFRELEGLSITLPHGRIGSTSLNDLCNLKYLKALSLMMWSSELVGPISQCLCNMRSLTSLFVIDFGRLSGSFSRDIMNGVGMPSCLGNLRNLESLQLFGIKVVGNTTFLDDLCDLKYLRVLKLHGMLSSSGGRRTPQCLCNMRSQLTALEVADAGLNKEVGP